MKQSSNHSHHNTQVAFLYEASVISPLQCIEKFKLHLLWILIPTYIIKVTQPILPCQLTKREVAVFFAHNLNYRGRQEQDRHQSNNRRRRHKVYRLDRKYGMNLLSRRCTRAKASQISTKKSPFFVLYRKEHQRTIPHSANFSKPPRPAMYCRAISTISAKGTSPI